jgi:hypothetical protein
MRRFDLLAVVLFVAVIGAACDGSHRSPESPTGPTATAPAPTAAEPAAATVLAHGAKPNTPPVVSLNITVSNTDGSGGPSGITNDGLGDYVDGLQNVQAQLDSSGTLAFNASAPRRGSASRWVTYDFSHPVDPSNLFQPGQDHALGFHFSTGPSAYSPWVPVQYLGTPGYPSSECGYMGNSFSDDSATAYRVSFHKAAEDDASSPTSFVVFTRVSVTPAVWTVEAAGSCSPNSNVAALRRDSDSYLYGYYSIPLYFTLTAR